MPNKRSVPQLKITIVTVTMSPQGKIYFYIRGVMFGKAAIFCLRSNMSRVIDRARNIKIDI